MEGGLEIRKLGKTIGAREGAALHGLVCELADYERLPMLVDERGFLSGLEAASHVSAALAWEVGAAGERAVGYMLWYPTFSTFRGRSRLFLEDLYVTPTARGRGHGKAMLATLAREAVRLGAPVLQWQVLAWNELAIGFYRGLGAELDEGWSDCRLTGEALERLASAAAPGALSEAGEGAQP